MAKEKNYYTREDAMQQLRLMSVNAFLQLERKYPKVFANINPKKDKYKQPWYEKAAVDKFVQTREDWIKKEL
jgi:hypothetical protein